MPRGQRVRRGVLPAESEAAWQQFVVNVALHGGWRVFHAPPGGHAGRVAGGQLPSGFGFPDLLLVRASAIVVAELKKEKAAARVTVAEAAARPAWLQHRDLTNEQAAWLEALWDVGHAIDATLGSLVCLGGGMTSPPSLEVFVWRPSDREHVERVLLAR
ncbi:MAG: hypothetical protein WKF96_00275 [Solirubrobacteraceae bacterium]